MNLQTGILIIQCIILLFSIITYIKMKKNHSNCESEKVTQALLGRLEVGFQRDLSSGRIEQSRQLSSMEDAITGRVLAMGKGQQELLRDILFQNREENFQLNQRLDSQLEGMHKILHQRLSELANDNQEKLEQIRLTVDDKLHHTLENRLGQSFKIVSERLEEVYKCLGEMRVLASDVGDLKKVLTNVKTRGILGEIQLEAILNQVLSPDQFAKNIKPIPQSKEIVEFALILPGHSKKENVFLPIDAKFPLESYRRLIEAYDQGNKEGLEKSGRELENAVKKSAGDIHGKYIYPPYTTDFAILFLPIEGLYAEITRRGDLIEQIQRKYKVILAGPSTFAALLNSLQMGFRTLAIQRQSAEVWGILTQVKGEFEKFKVVLERTQQKLSEAGEDLDKLVGVRSRQIIKQLDRAAILDVAYKEQREIES